MNFVWITEIVLEICVSEKKIAKKQEMKCERKAIGVGSEAQMQSHLGQLSCMGICIPCYT